jgi:hypothetical protein
MLVDTSGTYVKELKQANLIIRALVSELEPGDHFMLAKIDSDSFSEKDVVVNMKFDSRTSYSNKQKRALIRQVSRWSKKVKSSRYTDITGGVMQAVEYLGRSNAGKKHIILFTDLKEDLRRGQVRKFDLKFDGIKVVSINVTKLRSDSRDPRKYYKRLKKWETRVRKGKGKWVVISADEKEKILDVVMR